MFETPNVMRMAQDLARYSGARTSLIAKNIANADTPGYRARDFSSFAEALSSTAGGDLRRTRAAHMQAGSADASWRVVDAGGTPSPNGNTVSLEEEMVRATRAQSDHNMALAVYRGSLDILRGALGRGR
ncbi:FlgB family protein [Alphaproteobacteria bacterium GH1-50]|uniref:Flagellar basal body rod protein FlgB n=1 Tax=Kangsaoukella pontilimi TaxID=2691042 RepID=A0A7C9MW71_9RHOB|nr:FlgB family protein [Kangsaoukella pontilimi]MXQ08180.1 FlgB family protein [Kangsaoukella pontilimi]